MHGSNSYLRTVYRMPLSLWQFSPYTSSIISHFNRVLYTNFLKEIFRADFKCILGSNSEVFLDEVKCYAKGHKGNKEPRSGIRDHPDG